MVRAAVPVGWIAMAREDDLRLQLGGAASRCLKIDDLKPQEHTVSRREVRVADPAVMMLNIPAMQLKNQAAGRNQSLILRTAVIAPTAEQPLIPATTRLNVTHTDKGLRAHKISVA